MAFEKVIKIQSRLNTSVCYHLLMLENKVIPQTPHANETVRFSQDSEKKTFCNIKNTKL